MRIIEIVPCQTARRNALYALANHIDSNTHPMVNERTYQSKGYTNLGMLTMEAVIPTVEAR